MKQNDALDIDQFTKILKTQFILKSYSFVSIILLSFSIYFYFVSHLLLYASMCLFFLGLFLIIQFCARKGLLSFKSLVHFQNLFLLSLITLSFFVSGGLRAPSLFWLPAVVFSTMSLIGRKNMLIWLGAGLTIVTVFLVLEINGTKFNNFQNESNRYILHFIHFTLLSIYTLSIAILNEKTNREYARVQNKLTEELYHQNRLASLGEIVAGVSHEINNPLAIAAGNTAILSNLLDREKIANPKILKSLKNVGIAHDRIVSIVKSLQTFYRKSNDNQGNTNLKSLMDETFMLIEKDYQNDNIQLIYPEEIPSVEVKGNYTQIQQILFNLLSNSRDALGSREKKTIEISFDQSISNQLGLIVKDNGDGIPENILGKVIDPFFTTKDVNKGTGLGLSIIHNFVKNFGGEIKIESTEGVGTTIKVILNRV